MVGLTSVELDDFVLGDVGGVYWYSYRFREVELVLLSGFASVEEDFEDEEK